MSDLRALQQRALEIRQRYNDLNKRDGRDAWGGKEYAMGFVGDVGGLVKLVMAKENLRSIDRTDEKLAHELADCLWSVLVLADYYKVDIEHEFLRTMDELQDRINKAES